MGLPPWAVSPIDPSVASGRRVDRWANPHLRSRQVHPSERKPRQTCHGVPREANSEPLLIERREAWNVGK